MFFRVQQPVGALPTYVTCKSPHAFPVQLWFASMDWKVIPCASVS